MANRQNTPRPEQSGAESHPSDRIHEVALQLFVAVWSQRRGAINAETIAGECYEGAAAFCRVSASFPKKSEPVQDSKSNT